MSLRVYLYGEAREKRCYECGETRQVREELYAANITHNLTDMASRAGLYLPVWRPESVGITKARQLINPLENGLASMRAEPSIFIAYNSPNGWGTYENFVPWLQHYLDACKEHPDADVSVSR